MKKHINLFQKHAPREVPIRIQILTHYGTVLGIILFVFFCICNVYLFTLKREIQSLEDEKKQLLTYMIGNKDSEAGISYLVSKKNQLNTYLGEDAEFLKYYKFLTNLVETSYPGVKVERMNLDNSQSTQFTLVIPNYNSLYEVMAFMEDDSTLSNFITLTLDRIDFNNLQEDSERIYKLNFQGQFKKLDK